LNGSKRPKAADSKSENHTENMGLDTMKLLIQVYVNRFDPNLTSLVTPWPNCTAKREKHRVLNSRSDFLMPLIAAKSELRIIYNQGRQFRH
jgi:hypothetical protein